jgi:formylglycine-generating enzyme required for sulfatase activity
VIRVAGSMLCVVGVLLFAAASCNDTRDCAACPQMVAVPGGSFSMGSPPGDRQATEQPVHDVSVRPFSMSRYEIRFDEWDACVKDRGCNGKDAIDQDWGRGAMPAFNVDWNDAQAYVRWLSRKSGKRYRLPTEAEWEYAARAGSRERYSWGSEMQRGHAVCFSECGPEADQPSRVGTTTANAFGLHDLHGNLWEWVQDCWHATYDGAPRDGSAWEQAGCTQRTIRGGSWNCTSFDVRSTVRGGMPHSIRYNTVGIRVVRDD